MDNATNTGIEQVHATLDTTPNGYGFGHDWTLVVTYAGQTQRFWLGQDAKVCYRLLGMNGRELADALELACPVDMTEQRVLDTVGTYILAALLGTYQGGDDRDAVADLMACEPWQFAVE
jgi:hypothetical protein